MKKPNYRLSTDEVERLVKEETDRRRKLRIVQVREQAKANAALIRNKVQSEKDRLLRQFAENVKNDLVAEKAEKLRKLEQKYDNTLRTVGQGHREVHVQGDGQNIAMQKHREEQVNRNIAEERFKAAVKKHERDKTLQEWEDTRHIRNRKLALEVEKDRAAAIASLPPPPPDISAELEKIQKKAIPMTDMKAFATTHFHIPDFQVVKAGPDEQTYDAKESAQESDLRLKQDLAEKKRSQHERVERARIRGNEALQREMLKHDLGDMLQDLSLLQRKDRRRRQGLLADVPKQVFIPPERCMEERADREIEMERKFEDLYLKQQKSDSGSTQVWSELPTSAQESSESSTATLESVPLTTVVPMAKEINPALRDVTNLTKPTSGKEPDTVLKQLLDRIKEQRNNAIASHHKVPTSVLTSSNGKPASECDAQSVLSAGSRASWRKTLVDEEDEMDYGEGKGRDGMDAAKESSSGLDGVTLTRTSNMIEELQERIKMIEEQKLQLSEQLQSQTDFYKKFQQLQQKQQLVSLHPTRSNLKDDDDDRDASLSEVSLTSSQKIRFNIPSSSSKISPADHHHHHQSGLSVVSNGESPSVDLSSVASNLRPVFGILKGPKNPSYELLTSNGFLPLPDMNQGETNKNVARDACDLEACTNGKDEGSNGDLNSKPREGESSVTGNKGARRMIDFKSKPSTVTFGRQTEAGDRRSPGSPSSDLARLDSTGGSLRNADDQLGKRMKDYQLRAESVHVNLDEDTMTKVREYQDRLLQTHEERKEFLSNVRADIERRRQALYNTAKFSSGVESHLMNLGVPSSGKRPDTEGYTLGLSSNHKYQTFEPIAPFIADSWINKAGGKQDDQVTFGTLQQTPGDLTTSTGNQNDAVEQGDNLASRYRGIDNNALDHIRKSLPFDDLNDSNFDTSVARDNLNDTSRSHGPSEDSKFLSSEEERGSPILTGSRSDSRYDMSDKSNISVTGSSSLNGSVLVARAEERREGFERRQEELRRQLSEIQSQKEAILQRYYDGQQVLSRQQESLKAKLASTASASQVDPALNDFQGRGWQRGKPSFIGSESESGVEDVWQDDGSQHLIRTQSSKQPSVSDKRESPTSWSDRLKQCQNDSGDNSKLGQTHTSSRELSTNSYLDDISYRQIRENQDPIASQTSSQKSVSSSIGDVGTDGDPRAIFDMRSKTFGRDLKRGSKGDGDGNLPAMQTWASILQSTHGSRDDDPERKESASLDAYPHHQHQAHELSTILEVDTPTASSVHSSSVARAMGAPSHSNPSLSHGSNLSLISRWDSDVKVDAFVDPPHTFPSSSLAAGTMAYDLSSGAELRGMPQVEGGRRERSGISLTETSRAARSLYFQSDEDELGSGAGQRSVEGRFLAGDLEQPPRHSPANISGASFQSEAIILEGEDSTLHSQSIRLEDDKDVTLESRSLSPDYLDRIQGLMPSESSLSQGNFDSEIHVEVEGDGQEELSATTMPDLVGLTPIKPQLPDESGTGANSAK